jgi:hypothetical protein
MVFWILLAAWLLAGRRRTLAVLALLAGALIKYIPLLLLPAAIGIALSDLEGLRPRLRYLIVTVVAGMALVYLAYRPFWAGPETLTIERRAQLFTSSLPAITFHLLEPELGKETAGRLVSLGTVGLTAIFIVWRSWRASRDERWSSFAKTSFDILAFYLLVTCMWFQQWYTLWLVGIAAILLDGYRQRFTIFFSIAAFSKPLLAGPLLFRPKPIYPQPRFEILFTLVALGLPWLYWLTAKRET